MQILVFSCSSIACVQWAAPDAGKNKIIPVWVTHQCLSSSIKSKIPSIMALSANPGLHLEERTSKV